MSSRIECPICGLFYDSAKINGHVNLCLSKDVRCETRNVKMSRPSEDPKDRSPWPKHSMKSHEQKDDVDEKRESVTTEQKNLPEKKEKASHTGLQGNGLQNSVKSLSDVLGKRSFPGNKDNSPNESTKRLKMSPSSISEKHPNNPPSACKLNKLQNPNNNGKFPRSVATKVSSELPIVDLSKGIPLAEQLRPTSFEEYFGQNEALGNGSSIRLLLESDRIPSIILWGPPGCGKTSLVNVITANCKKNQHKRFVKISATTSGINDVKEAVKIAKNELTLFKRETILFIDEIHRFNKLQQDFFLPHVENGTITLIGATTENPSFHVNNALLSRCKVVVLNKHTTESIIKILERAVAKMGGVVNSSKTENSTFAIENTALEMLANLCDGDARSALNALEMAVNANKQTGLQDAIKTEQINAVLQRNHVLYDKNGEEHYNIISALHKSIRGSDDNAALYWLARMLEGGESPLYIARRLVRIASEDIGLADSSALTKATAAYQACHFIGMPECDVILAHIVVYLARAPKSVEVYKAYRAAQRLVNNWKGPLPGVPLHLRNAPTKLMKQLGYAKDYKYNPDYDEHIEQEYFPKELIGTNLFSD